MRSCLSHSQSRWRLLALLYGTRLTGFCRMQSNINIVMQNINPMKFSIADAIKMYLKKPLTSLQLTSLLCRRKNEEKKKNFKKNRTSWMKAQKKSGGNVMFCVLKATLTIERSDLVKSCDVVFHLTLMVENELCNDPFATRILYICQRTDNIGHHGVVRRLERHYTSHSVVHRQSDTYTPKHPPWC